MKLLVVSFYLLTCTFSSLLLGKPLENRQVPLARGLARPGTGTILHNENPSGLILNKDLIFQSSLISSEKDNLKPVDIVNTAYYGTEDVAGAVGIMTTSADAKDDFGFAGGGAFVWQNLSLGLSGTKHSSSTEIVDLVFGFLYNPYDDFKWGGVFYNTESYYYHFGFGLSYEFLDQFAIGLDIFDVRNHDRFELYPGIFATFRKYALGISYKITTQAEANIPPADRVSASVAYQLGKKYDLQLIYNYLGKAFIGVGWSL